MLWEGISVGILALVLVYAAISFVDRRQRAVYAKTLPKEKYDELIASETAGTDWRSFREWEASAEERRLRLQSDLAQKSGAPPH